MTAPLSLLEFLQELLSNASLRDHFTAEPEQAMEEYGLSDLSPADVHDALVLLEDNRTVDFSRDYSTDTDGIGYVPPAPASHGEHQDAVEYLNAYLTHNHVDSSIDLDQYIDIDSTVTYGDVGHHARAVGGNDDTMSFGAGDAAAAEVAAGADGGLAGGRNADLPSDDTPHDVDIDIDIGDYGDDRLAAVDDRADDIDDFADV